MASLSDYITTNFPSPSDGDEFVWGGVRYTYDTSPGLWVGSLPNPDDVQDVATGNTAPSNPITGELWYDQSVNRLKVYNGTEFVDSNPKATAADLGLSLNNTVAVEDSGTQRFSAAAALNFGDGITVETGTGTTATIKSALPVTPAADSATVMNYGLRVGTDGTLTWQTIDNVLTSAGLGSIGNVVAPANAANGTIISKNGNNYEARTLTDAGVASSSDLTTTNTNVSNLTTRVTNLESTDLGDLDDVSTSGATSGQVLAYNGSSWAPAAPQAGSGSNQVVVSNGGKTITVAGTATDIPTITAAALSGNNLNLTTNGSAADLTVDLSSISSTNPAVATNTSNISALTTRVAALENADFATEVVVSDDGAAINNLTNSMDFTGDGVTVSNTGAGRVSVNIPGGGSSATPAIEQTAFDRSSERSDKTQFNVQGGSNGGKFRIIIKNNSATATQNIKYTFGSDQRGTAADHIAAGVTYGDLPGLWDSDDSAGKFTFYPSGSNGSMDWAINSNIGLASRNIIQLEVDIKVNGRMDFFTSSSSDVVWSVASLGGFVETGTGGTDGGGGGSSSDPGPNYANGTPAVPPEHGPFFISRGVGHYDMAWRLGGGNSIKFDQIMGGNGSSAQTGGRNFYRPSDTSENQGLWIVAFSSSQNVANDASSLGWGVILPGSSGNTSTQAALNTLTSAITSSSFPSAQFNFLTSSGGTDPDASGGFKAAPISAYGPSLGPFANQLAFTSASQSQNWFSAQSCHFYLPGANPSMGVELRRGNLRMTRQSPLNPGTKMYAYELYFRIYTPS